MAKTISCVAMHSYRFVRLLWHVCGTRSHPGWRTKGQTSEVRSEPGAQLRAHSPGRCPPLDRGSLSPVPAPDVTFPLTAYSIGEGSREWARRPGGMREIVRSPTVSVRASDRRIMSPLTHFRYQRKWVRKRLRAAVFFPVALGHFWSFPVHSRPQCGPRFPDSDGDQGPSRSGDPNHRPMRRPAGRAPPRGVTGGSRTPEAHALHQGRRRPEPTSRDGFASSSVLVAVRPLRVQRAPRV